jgi:hypothetical protein
VPSRTYLTTPPGREPSAATGRSASGATERYVPGLEAPTEPALTPRWRRPLLVVTGIVLVATVALVLSTSLATQAEDPSLGPQPDAASPPAVTFAAASDTPVRSPR